MKVAPTRFREGGPYVGTLNNVSPFNTLKINANWSVQQIN